MVAFYQKKGVCQRACWRGGRQHRHRTEFIIKWNGPLPELLLLHYWNKSDLKYSVCSGIKTLPKLCRDLDESKQHENLSSWFFIMFGYTVNKDFSTENPQQHPGYQYQHSNINAINNKTVILILPVHIKSLWTFIW